MVFLGMILGFIVSKYGKLPKLKKIQAIINMPPPKNPIQVFNAMAQFYKCFITNFVVVVTPTLGSQPRQGLAKVRAKYEA
jgi:hypothetical protein